MTNLRDEFEKAFDAQKFGELDEYTSALWAAKWAMEKSAKEIENNADTYYAKFIRQLARGLDDCPKVDKLRNVKKQDDWNIH